MKKITIVHVLILFVVCFALAFLDLELRGGSWITDMSHVGKTFVVIMGLCLGYLVYLGVRQLFNWVKKIFK